VVEEAARPGGASDYPWPEQVQRVERIWRGVRAEYPWSVTAPEIMGTYHLARGASAKAKSKRVIARFNAQRYADTVANLLDTPDTWLGQVRPAIEAINIVDD
jgi:hypothetical protein